MQLVSKILFALLLSNILILNLVYVFSKDGNLRSLKTNNVQELFAKDGPVPRLRSEEPKGHRTVVSKQAKTVSQKQNKTPVKIPTKESIENDIRATMELVRQVKEQRLKIENTLNRNKMSPIDNNPYKLLGGYKQIPLSFYKDSRLQKPHFNVANYHLIHEADYCDRVDNFNLKNPDNMFIEKNFFTDLYKIHPRKQIERFGKVPMKQDFNAFGKGKYTPHPDAKGFLHRLDITINNFFVYNFIFHFRHEIGQDFNCATQMYNRIPGHEPMVRKDISTDNLVKYMKGFGGKTQCYPDGIFPQFYRLYDMDECFKFFKIINSDKYKKSLKDEPLQYLVKVGKDSHRSDGVFLLDGKKTKNLNEAYNFGAKCGDRKDSLIAQAYIANPLLLDQNNKFDFRVYMLIASTNPYIVYYHDGFLRVALSSYDKFSRERGTHLTNTHLAKNKFEEARQGKVDGMDEKQLMEYHQWKFEELQDYLLKTGKVSDPNWLENELRPQFKKAFVHVVRMSKDSLWKGSNVYQLFGLDFMLDDNLKLWYIEGNPNPQLGQSTKKAAKIINKMLKDLFEVEFAYYRSRMHRVKKVIDAVQAEYVEKGYVHYEEWTKKYQDASKNKLEPEYAISSNNTWSLVMDENLPGTSAYLGAVPRGCLLN